MREFLLTIFFTMVISTATMANTVFVPSQYGTTMTYEREFYRDNETHGWKRNSPQGQLRIDAISQGRQTKEDILGLTNCAVIDGRLQIATTPNIGGELKVDVGDYIDVIFTDGTVWNCIIADIKNTKDYGCTEWGHDGGRSTVEIMYWNNHGNSGNQYKKIEAIRKAGNFWEEYAFE